VRVAHAHEPTLRHPHDPPLAVAEPRQPGEDASPEVELEAVIQHLCGRRTEPAAATGTEVERQPVGRVDQALVVDGAARDLGVQPVVDARDVGTRVVDVVGD
jgi:hypothetical protein